MNKRILFLIGMAVGGILTIATQRTLNLLRQPSPHVIKEMLESSHYERVERRFMHDFCVVEMRRGDDYSLGIIPTETLYPMINISKDANNTLSVNISDKGSSTYLLQDNDRDGIWDERRAWRNGSTYLFPPDSEYPSAVRNSSNTVVSIDGTFYDVQNTNNGSFINKDGKSVEIEAIKPGVFIIKAANQRLEPTPDGAAHP